MDSKIVNHSSVYPRTYGGTTPAPIAVTITTGLSPHIRGNVGKKLRNHIGMRSIPAHTGERSQSRISKPLQWVYPRTYGGTESASMIVKVGKGLSPHIRGNGRTRYPDLGTRGSIPAHTGERFILTHFNFLQGVYPRTYGGTFSPRSCES